jgi:pimeloyl-ACP methyl ester carboxylesterase
MDAMKLALASLSLCALSTTAVAGPAPQILPAAAAPDAAAKVPWLTADAASRWPTGAPTFELRDAAVAAHAKGWIATTNDLLLVRVVVNDEHPAGRAGEPMWQGDFVRVAIDGRGDRARGGAPEAHGPFGPDDVSLGLSRGPDGPSALVFGGGGGDLQGTLSADVATVARDEAAHTTTYDLRLPWRRLAVMPGALPTFGIAVQVKDVEPGRPDGYLRYGEGASDLRAARFQTLAFADPPAPYVGVTATNAEVWGAATPAELAVVVAAPRGGKIAASGGASSASLPVPASSSPRRFVVRRVPTASEPDPRLDVVVTAPGAAAAKASEALTVPDALFAALWRRLDELTAAAPHPLFLRHLRSVRALTESERGRLEAYRDDPAKLRETVAQIRALLAGFRGDAGDWRAYLDGRRSLVLAFVSKRDASLQSYFLTLPAGWDPAKPRDAQARYPLLVELHGAGNPHPMVWLSDELGAGAKARDLLGYESAKSFASQQRAGYHVQPFGRGNSGYADIGEIDVWEAVADAKANFAIDEDRQYLFGFSMGGAGTWSLGARTPDRWAALAVYGASPEPGKAIGLARNLANTPVWHWNGEEDHFAGAGSAAFAAELRRAGVPLVHATTPKLGHVYLAEKQKEGVLWLEQHTRKRPARFSFVADRHEHPGVWGVTMEWDPTVAAPSFDCAIEGGTVRLDTRGARGLLVSLGADGLGLSGDVEVFWNGKPAYKGPAKTIRLPAVVAGGASPPPRAAMR